MIRDNGGEIDKHFITPDAVRTLSGVDTPGTGGAPNLYGSTRGRIGRPFSYLGSY